MLHREETLMRREMRSLWSVQAGGILTRRRKEKEEEEEEEEEEEKLLLRRPLAPAEQTQRRSCKRGPLLLRSGW